MAEGESAGEQFDRLKEEYEGMSPKEQEAYRKKVAASPRRDIGGEQEAAERGVITPKQREASEALKREVEKRKKA